MLTAQEVLNITDGIAGMVDAAAAPLAAVLVKAQAQVGRIYGRVVNGAVTVPPLSDNAAIDALGPATKQSVTQVSGPGFYAAALGPEVAALSSYFQRNRVGAIVDLASFIRSANGCPDPSTAGAGAGSNYTWLIHPSFAALISTLSGGASLLPPDVVFAPTGAVIASMTVGGPGVIAASLNQPASVGGLPYAPTTHFTSMAGVANITPVVVPNGSFFVTLTGTNQAGASVTWRGDVGTGYSGAGSYLNPRTLLGTDGGANGGTAAPTDSLVRVTAFARDMTVSGGGTATVGAISIITVSQRAST